MIIPAFNAAGSIGRAISSVIQQTHWAFEILVVDDDSTDQTAEVVRSINDDRIRLFSLTENCGPAAARNLALDNAKGTWVAFLDADDWWDEIRLEQLFRLARNSDATMVADNQRLYFANGGVFYKNRLEGQKEERDSCKEIAFREFIERSLGILQPIIKSDFLNRSNIRFNENITHGEDFLFITECFTHGGRLLYTSRPFYNASLSASSLTADRTITLRSMAEIYRSLRRDNAVVEHGLENVVSRKIRSLEQSIQYSEIMDAFKNHHWRFGFRRVLSTPRFFVMALKRLPRSVGYRVSGFARRGR